ncbi:hypothetical protein, partial [Hoylesella oralis]|uniref:hypothetical protein n=1 Tax=Hoylesella oralis TaxID=28134 RepID=UPI00361E4EDB
PEGRMRRYGRGFRTCAGAAHWAYLHLQGAGWRPPRLWLAEEATATEISILYYFFYYLLNF